MAVLNELMIPLSFTLSNVRFQTTLSIPRLWFAALANPGISSLRAFARWAGTRFPAPQAGPTKFVDKSEIVPVINTISRTFLMLRQRYLGKSQRPITQLLMG